MKYIKDYIPKSEQKRPGYKMNPTTITIHNNANPNSTARNERNWLTNPNNTRWASYHIVVDEIEAIEVTPLNEIAYHAGNKTGNRTSIGIEICERGDYNQTMLNEVKVVADLLEKLNMTTKNLRQHFDWSGKNCPRKIRAGYLGWTWDKFIDEINKELNKRKVVEIMSKYFNDVPANHWGAESLDRNYERKIIVGDGNGNFKPNNNITRIEVSALIDRVINYVLDEMKG